MMYDYKTVKPQVFSEEGYEVIKQINRNSEGREVFTVNELIKRISGDSWLMLACIDWLVENKEMEYISTNGAKQQHILRRLR